MANYDELNGNMRALYDAAKQELADMEKKRTELENIVNVLSPIYGSSKKTYSVEGLKAVEAAAPRAARRYTKKSADKVSVAKSDKKPRIKEAVIRNLVMQYLSDAYPNSMSAGEIFGRLEKEGMPSTTSFRTRIYGKLGTWTEDGTLERPERGVYRIKNPVSK